MIGFLDVVLRGLALAGQALAVGGALFLVFVLRPGRPDALDAGPPSARRTLALMAWAAVALAGAQAASLLLHMGALADDNGWPVGPALDTNYFRAGLIRMAAAVALAGVCVRARRTAMSVRSLAALIAVALVLSASAAYLSHAAARLEHTRQLLVLDALHQLAASAWVGGLAHLAAASGRGASVWPASLLARFSALALTSVAVLIAAGLGLSLSYVGGLAALIGTSYGVMVLVKVVMLAGLLTLGAANFFVVRRLADGPPLTLTRVRRFVEVELGLGLTVLFAAASLTSLPPAVDVVGGRASLGEVATRFVPRLPRLTSPPLETMPVGDREAPRTDEDRAWSEYNHHISGMLVLAMGILAIVNQVGGGGRWARHWPLVFLVLAGFMLVRNDPGSWPLGPQGFWEGFAYPSVLQHRVFVLMVAGFGIFEWMVRAGRIRSRICAQVFPILCVVGGALLLTHSHAQLNVKEEFLIEVTHAPLGLLSLAMGWGRWLELRLPPPEGRWPGRLWAVAFAAIGGLLIIYRES